ncbi:tetratricopeptide repeat protein [Geothrix fermentans]|uniref:tetratricopeptide repeat protein n=1 Tax=Geothrix fermentans TaxID=44676 RepID=UPI00041AA88B|nr:tetratricopeptide repeat protein [Geothrix fermentans]
MAARRAPVEGLAVWARPLGLLALILFGPLALLSTPLHFLGLTWLMLLLLSLWTFLVAAFIGAMARAGTPATVWLERRLRAWVARFAPDPEALWLHWARQAHRPEMARLCLERAAGLGGAEALFQEGLVYLEGGFGPGGQLAAVDRLRRAAERGHPEAAFRLAEALRTGHGVLRDPAQAEGWYQRAAASGWGPAAAWLAHAHAEGDGVARDAEQARRWAEAAVRLRPHASASRSLLRHDAGGEDPLVRVGAEAAARVEAAAGRVVAHRAGRWALGLGAVVLACLALGTAGTFFWVGSSSLHHLPLLMLAPPALLLAWQAWRLRRDRPKQGRDRLREAAEGGDPEACYRLGLAYRQGSARLPKDDLSAALWFRRAAEAGHREAMRALADAYLGGHGVLRDPREAARWAEASRQAFSG